MRRVFRPALIVLSLAVAVALAALWWRTPRYGRAILLSVRLTGGNRGNALVASEAGRFGVMISRESSALIQPAVLWIPLEESMSGIAAVARHGRRGFGIGSGRPPGSEIDEWVTIGPAVVAPAWAPIAVSCGVAGVLSARAWRDRRTAGRCAGCGYDLRASPDRCPECGRAAPQREPAGVDRSTPAGS